MSKAVGTPLCVLLFVVSALTISAQPSPPADSAVQEAVRRDAARIELRQKLEKARDAELRHDLPNAAKLYDDAWTLVETIGPSSEPEAQETIAGLSNVRLQLARNARHRGDLRDAEIQVKDVLRVNPNDAIALAFYNDNKRMMEAQRGKVPSIATQEQIPAIESDKIQAATYIQDGRLLFQMGKLDEADAKLKQAMRLDPANKTAEYYATLVEQSRARVALGKKNIDDQKRLVQVEQAWEDPVKRELLPWPNPMVHTNLIYTGKGRQAILTKLDRIHLDTVFYDGLPLSEVIRSLSEEVKRRDPDRRGINILINPNQETVAATPVTAATGGGAFGIPAGANIRPIPAGVPAPAGIDPSTGLPISSIPAAGGGEQRDINAVSIKINPALTDARLADVLDAIVTVADSPIRYSILDYTCLLYTYPRPRDRNRYRI